MTHRSFLVLAAFLTVLARAAVPAFAEDPAVRDPAASEAGAVAAPSSEAAAPAAAGEEGDAGTAAPEGELAPPSADGDEASAPSAAAPAPAGAPVLAPGEKIHEVVRGDTLWDLAAKYLGSPWRWKEIWERNRFLTNPHFIYPGTKILVIPPASREYALGGKEALPSPEAVFAPIPKGPAPKGPGILAINPEDYVRSGELLSTAPKGIGRIRGAEGSQLDYSEGDVLYLSLKKDLPAGQLLGAYRVRGPVRLAGGKKGYVKYLAGVLQVTGKKGGYHLATVRKSFEELRKDTLLSEEIPSYRDTVIRGTSESIRGTVVASRLENTELATGDVVFIDRGSDAGVTAGDRFHLLDEKHDGGSPGGKKALLPRDVGTAVVVRTTGAYSTAFVVDSVRSFQAGVTALGISDAGTH
jgi:LysM repeat protein